jgi:hypothetical protein
MDEKNPKYNASHCYDPTPFKAINNISREHDKEREILAKKVIKTIQNVAHLAGFDIVGKITLREHKTGEIRR